MKFTRYPKRDAIRDYFPLPNEIFCLGLSSGEIAVYAYLLRCENRKTFQCHPSYKTIGNAVGMSKNTVKKYVDSLIEKQLITAEPTSVITQKRRKAQRQFALYNPPDRGCGGVSLRAAYDSFGMRNAVSVSFEKTRRI
ncbi:helix-turn-helix domain-containing protein [[Eubacterium] siraeum]|nr:helix-turn-helix domain-containing protein [[Eubacterium] siraeum]